MRKHEATIDTTVPQALEVAIDAAIEAGKHLLGYFNKRKYKLLYKADTSLQTTADTAAEEVIIQRLSAAFPQHSIWSEECGSHYLNSSSSYRWSIDPLDGTENFVLGIPYFSSSLTLYHKKLPLLAVVYNPLTEDLFTAIRGNGSWHNGHRLLVSQHSDLEGCRVFFIPDFATKRQSLTMQLRDILYSHCRRVLDTWAPALDWCLVASGEVDLVVTLSESYPEADTSAGMLILTEAGGKITDFSGRSNLAQNKSRLIGSNATPLHDQILLLIKGVYSYENNGRPLY